MTDNRIQSDSFDREGAIEGAFSDKRLEEATRLIEAALIGMPDGWSPLIEAETKIEGSFWDQEEFLAYSQHFRDLGESRTIFWQGMSYSKLWWRLAVINRQGEKYQVALDCVDRGIQLEPDHPYLWVQRGLALCALARYDEALFAYQTGESIRAWSPDRVKAWVLRSQGYVLVELGRLTEARSVHAQSLELDPEDENAKNEVDYIEHLLDEQELKRRNMPTPADLFRAWQEGGKEKLRDMLEKMPEEDDEE